MLNWDSIISSLELQEGISITTDPNQWNLDTPGYTDIYKIWQTANFNASAIKWTNFYPGTHFPLEIVNSLALELGLNGVHRSWISCIDPGFMAPWHWDVDENETEYLKRGPIIRYTLIIRNFAHGHIFILGDEYFYNLQKGKVIPWKTHREWHSGINAGMEPNWLFHILGY